MKQGIWPRLTEKLASHAGHIVLDVARLDERLHAEEGLPVSPEAKDLLEGILYTLGYIQDDIEEALREEGLDPDEVPTRSPD